MKVLLLGGGYGNLTICRELGDYIANDSAARKDKLQITLVEKESHFHVGFMNGFVFLQVETVQSTGASYKNLFHSDKISLVSGVVTKIIPNEKRVEVLTLDDGEEGSISLSYDKLIVGLGSSYYPQDVPGLDATFNLNDIWHMDPLRNAVDQIKEGQTLVVGVPRMPYKCPPAPVQFLLMCHDRLVQRGLHNKVNLIYFTVENQPISPTGEFGKAYFNPLLEEKKGVKLLTQHKILSVDPQARVIKFEGKEDLHYDLLVTTWPQRAPPVLQESGMTNEQGFLPATLGSFATPWEGIYAVGDCAWAPIPNSEKFPPMQGITKPFPKSGEFARNAGLSVARLLLKEIELSSSTSTGESSLEETRDKLGLAKCGMDLGTRRASKLIVDLNLDPKSLEVQGPFKFQITPESEKEWESLYQDWIATMNSWFKDWQVK
jgi:sulfide:quinone oxidoreductase